MTVSFWESQNPSPKHAHKWTPEPTSISDPLFDQNFDQFMEGLGNLEPFIDVMAHPPQMADALWELVKLKKGKSKAPGKSSMLIFDKPWIKEPEGMNPT